MSISIDSLMSGALAVLLARRVIPMSLAEIRWQLVPPVLATVVAMGSIGSVENVLLFSASRPPMVALPLLAGQAVAFAMVFVEMMFRLAPRQAAVISATLRQVLRPAAA